MNRERVRSEYTVNRGEGPCGLLKCSHVTRRRDRHTELLYVVSLALLVSPSRCEHCALPWPLHQGQPGLYGGDGQSSLVIISWVDGDEGIFWQGEDIYRCPEP